MSMFIHHGGPTGGRPRPPVHHWDDLFNAVVYRLRHAVEPPVAAQLRATVLECADALDSLQGDLAIDQTPHARVGIARGPARPCGADRASVG